MSELVERVARRMAKLDGRDPDGTEGGPCHMGYWTDEGEPFWKGYVDAAQELIATLRQPTEAMLCRGSDQLAADWRNPFTASNAERYWRAMIDEALK